MLRLSLLLALLLGPAAHAYTLRNDAQGDPMRWRTPVKFVVDHKLATQLDAPEALDAVRGAVHSYARALPQLEIEVTEGMRVAAGYWPDPRTGRANANSIIADDQWPFGAETIAVAIYTYNLALKSYVDTDIVLNTRDFRFATDGRKDAVDVRNVLMHELGHALGLQHNPAEPRAVMYPSTWLGELTKRTLSRDDLEGLIALYASVAVELGGCAAAPSTTALPVALLAVVLLACRRRPSARRRPAGATLLARRMRPGAHLAAAGVALLALPAAAESAAPSELQPEQLALIATVQVVSARTLPPLPTHPLLRTEVTVSVRECQQGQCPAELTLTFPGGRLGDLVQVVEGLKIPSAGEVLGVALHREAQGSVRAPSPRATRVFRLDQARGFVAFGELLRRAAIEAARAMQPRAPGSR